MTVHRASSHHEENDGGVDWTGSIKHQLRTLNGFRHGLPTTFHLAQKAFVHIDFQSIIGGACSLNTSPSHFDSSRIVRPMSLASSLQEL
jgi:hypothetical protein